MNKKSKALLYIIICIVLCSTIISICFQSFKKIYKNTTIYNGKLKIENTSIINKFGEKIILKGLSSNGIQWDTSNCIDDDTLKYLNKNWGVNVFRIAVYTEENGYIDNKEKIYDKTINLIEKCINAKIYAIVDWHINKDGNPNKYKDEAIEFFDKISSKYAKCDNVIYEICNEPSEVTWLNDIVTYANEIIPVIRKNSPESVIIVGTPNYSRDVAAVANRELEFDNILYSFHFYAATHKDEERLNLEYAINQGVPVIVSEWGTSEYNGDGENNYTESDKWLKYLAEHEISWINWSYSYGKESSAILNENIINDTKKIEENLTNNGQYIKSKLLEK